MSYIVSVTGYKSPLAHPGLQVVRRLDRLERRGTGIRELSRHGRQPPGVYRLRGDPLENEVSCFGRRSGRLGAQGGGGEREDGGYAVQSALARDPLGLLRGGGPSTPEPLTPLDSAKRD